MTSPTTFDAAPNTTDKPEVLKSASGRSPEPETVGTNISHAVVIVAYLSVTVVSLCGNGIVILSVVTCRRMRTVTNYFIISLAGADLMMAVLCIPFTIIANWVVDRWPFGTAMCPIVTYLQTVVVFLSAYILVGLVLTTPRLFSYLVAIVTPSSSWTEGQAATWSESLVLIGKIAGGVFS